MKLLYFSLVFLLTCPVTAGGTYQDTSFVPSSLGFENPVRIYLPEGYNPGGTEDYPVIYWLHGWTGDYTTSSTMIKIVLDDLISTQQIPPIILVKPHGLCPPYGGSNWSNSILYGNYEDYVTDDLIDFIEASYCVLTGPENRSISGHSMGGSGSMKIALSHPDLYRAVASHAGFQDHMVALPLFVPHVLQESPESSPPYTYDWGNGNYTDALFMTSGANSPNLSAPDSIDFILDSNGDLVDSVYTLWELHNPAHMVKFMSQPIDLDIFFDCGTEDVWDGVYESNCSFSDTLTDLGIEHEFQSVTGAGHSMTIPRFTEAFLFMCEAMTGIESGESSRNGLYMSHPWPNPTRGTTSISFYIPAEGQSGVEVFDLAGRMVEVITRGEMESGWHSVIVNTDGYPPGMYFLRLTTTEGTVARRFLLLD